MDPSRHHEYIGSNEERSRANAAAAAYYNREVSDIASHRYYGSTVAAGQQQQHPPPPQQQQQQRPPPAPRSLSNTRNSCDCTTTPSGARITCNSCRLNPTGDMWPPHMANSSPSSNTATSDQHPQRGDYRQMVNETSMRSSMRQSPMYMQQQQHPPINQQMQHQPQPPPPPPHAAQALSHGPPPPPTQSMMQQHQHPSHAMSRTNYWSPNPSSAMSQHYGDEQHMAGIGGGPNHPAQSSTQTQIDISITRRSSAAPTGPVEGSMYGQYKTASMATHPSHSSSSYPPQSSTNTIHQHVSAISGGGQGPPAPSGGGGAHYITKERIYETKYSSKTTTTKIEYNTTSTAVYDNNYHMNNVALSNKSLSTLPIDHHVINPSNLPASKEQHPSPNYARKCPQMYSNPESAEQSTAHHHHLYMSPPQFSSDKFSRASPQQGAPDYTKLRESPLQSSGGGGSPYMITGDKYQQHMQTNQLRESPQFITQQQQQSSVSRNSSSYYNANQNPSKVHPPEMSPIIMKQSHTQYQYSKSPLLPPLPPSVASVSAATHQIHQIPPAAQNMGAKSNATPSILAPPQPTSNHHHHPPSSQPPQQRYIIDNVKREDLEIYETQPAMQQPSSRNSVGGGIYINPYNTPPPTGDACCKDVTPLSASTSPYTTGSVTPNYRVESPQQFYATKYGKMSMTDSSNKHTLINQNTPPPSRAPSQRGHQQPAYYYEGNPHSAPSPAAATAASPSPSLLLSSSSTASITSQSQIHHTEYVTTLQGGPPIGPPPPGHTIPQSYPTQPTAQHQSTTASLRANNEMLVGSQNSPLPYERSIPHPHSHPSHHHSQAQPPSKPTHHPGAALQQNATVQVQSANQHHASKIPANAAASNKHKPNYRELISRTLAIRNATSEEELNMQIIKKTLNVDSPNVRGPAAISVQPAPPSMANNVRGGPSMPPTVQQMKNINDRILVPAAGSDMSPVQAPPPSKPAPPIGSSVLVNHNSAIPLIPRGAESSRICVKQEDDKPSSSSSSSGTTTSPLDLSMRTVKTKADSTEYKYQQRRLTPSTNEGRYTLPRVDSTPVFSVHAFEPSATVPVVDITGSSSGRPSPQNSRHNSLERKNYTPPTQPINIQTPPAVTAMPAVSVGPAIYGPQSSVHQGNVNVNTNSSTPRRMGELHQISSMSNKPHLKGSYESSCVIKTAPKPSLCDRDIIRGSSVPQSRPSVLETNPYASVIKTEPKRTSEPTTVHMSTQAVASSTHHTLAAVERLPPDTSIMALPPKTSYNMQRAVPAPIIGTGPSSSSTTPPNYSQGCERNPNFRKRHIQEYSSQMSTGEPSIKQSRYLDSPLTTVNSKPVIPMRPADISVIAVNETNQHELERSLKSAKQMDMAPLNNLGGVIASTTSNVAQTAPVIVNNHSHLSPTVVVCKQEPLTPTIEVPPKLETPPYVNQTVTTTTNTSQPSSQMASSRIRTKAELKGFTFNPPPLVQTEIEPPPVVSIKQEELPPVKVKEEQPETTTTTEDITSIPGLEENFAESNLLDFGWSSTCNNFVEQLLTRPAKKKALPASAAASIKTTTKESYNDIVVSSTDVPNHKPMDINISNMESADTTRSSFARFEAMESSAHTMKSSSMNQDPLNSPSSSSVIHKKLNKIGREKKRFQQEKRLAERLHAKVSSSESEDELDKRKTERLKKPLLKSKIKLKSKSSNSNDNNSSSNQLNEKNRFSDCGSDSSSETEMELPNTKAKTLPSSPKKETSVLTTLNETVTEKEIKQEPINPDEEEKCDTPGKIKHEKEKEATPPNQEVVQKQSSSAAKADGKSTEVIVDISKKTTTPDKTSTETKKSQSSSSSSSSEESCHEDKDEEEGIEGDHNKSNKSANKIGNKCSKPVNSTSSNVGKYKVGLNTMTRSKLKKEMEAQLANSKVLRNDKIIRNSTTKIKRKYVRKYVNNVNSYLESGGLSRESGIMKSTRLKAKLERKSLALNQMKAKDKKFNKLGNNKDTTTANSNKSSKTESVHDRNVMDFIHFKRALKVPPSLISIKHPVAHKIAASLPDLERHAEALDAYAKKKKKSNFKGGSDKHKNDKSASAKAKAASEKDNGQDDEPRSIIDVLHSRVTKASGLNVSNKPTTTTASKPNKTSQSSTPKSYSANNCGMFSETSQTTESSELQLLPPLKQDSEEDDDDDNESATSGKKRHFSIFDTTVLPTKTRTESKLQQKRENIREIFVGDDRPASAPPEMTQAPDNGGEKMTYEQKYEQFLQQMNIVISADKFGRFGRTAAARKLILPTQQSSSSLSVKQEEVDTESTSVMDPDELKDDQKSETTHTIRKKRGKYLRRKGSSGFDYIRKKKKPSSSTISSSMHNHNSTNSSFQHFSIKAEKAEADEYENKVKTEDDVSREIQKWVLNKGVGQSTMHKAARQGYIDVIVYCLERMAMNPDQKDNAGYTPLHEACTNGWLDIARVLLQYGANHSAAAHSGIRPLHEASENDHEEIVRLLLSYGADPLLATYSG